MKETCKILIVLLFVTTSLIGQNISSSDSLGVVETSQTLLSAIESEDHKTLLDISTDEIYCSFCFETPDFSDNPYMIQKNDFLENYLPRIKDYDSYQRVTKSDLNILIKENDHRTDITALWTIYEQDELSPGHEGGQFGIYFQKVGDEFKFSGMEIIP